MQTGSIAQILGGAIGTLMLLSPLAGIILSYLRLCQRLGTTLAVRAPASTSPSTRPMEEKDPHPSRTRFLTAPSATPTQ